MREMLLTNLTKVIRFFFKAKQNSSALRFSAIKPDQNVSPPCCYWLLKEKPWHHYENCKLPACFPPSPPPASHTHTSSLTSALSFQILSISSLRCFCRCCPAATPLLLSDPLRHPNPQAPSLSTIFLPPPAFISTSHLASESHGSWIIHMCSSPGNFPAFWPFQKPLYVHHRWPACWYKTPTKERLWVCDCCLWVYLNVSSPHAAVVRKPTCPFALKSNKMGERENAATPCWLRATSLPSPHTFLAVEASLRKSCSI